MNHLTEYVKKFHEVLITQHEAVEHTVEHWVVGGDNDTLTRAITASELTLMHAQVLEALLYADTDEAQHQATLDALAQMNRDAIKQLHEVQNNKRP